MSNKVLPEVRAWPSSGGAQYAAEHSGKSEFEASPPPRYNSFDIKDDETKVNYRMAHLTHSTHSLPLSAGALVQKKQRMGYIWGGGFNGSNWSWSFCGLCLLEVSCLIVTYDEQHITANN